MQTEWMIKQGMTINQVRTEIDDVVCRFAAQKGNLITNDVEIHSRGLPNPQAANDAPGSRQNGGKVRDEAGGCAFLGMEKPGQNDGQPVGVSP